jgi:hypothetical protein
MENEFSQGWKRERRATAKRERMEWSFVIFAL